MCGTIYTVVAHTDTRTIFERQVIVVTRKKIKI